MPDFTYDDKGDLTGLIVETPEGPKVATLIDLPDRHVVGKKEEA